MASPLLDKRFTPWRWLTVSATLILIAAPLLFPFLEILNYLPVVARADIQRLVAHSLNSLWLVLGTLFIALPVGVALALLLTRTDLPARRFFHALVLFSLFLPLPLTLSAWQALFGSDGWLPMAWWESRPGQPWSSGLLPAVWVHALAGLPWVVVLVGLGLTWVERELEEEALLRGPPWWVCRHITLPRARGMIVVAGIFLALQAAGEITVTDMFQVSTLAEEVYLQLSLGDRPALARALLGMLPWLFLTAAFIALVAGRRIGTLPALDQWRQTAIAFPLGRMRWPVFALLMVLAICTVLVPLAGLVYKLGRLGPQSWSLAEALGRFHLALQLHGANIAGMLLLAAGTGALIAWVGLFASWCMNGSRRLTCFLCGLALLAAVLPAPAIGLGLKEMILWIVGWDDSEIFARVFYTHGPWSVIWAQTLRYFPFALAVGWVLIRLIPRALVEGTRLEGYGPLAEWRRLIWPLTRRAWFITAALLAALSLSETAASSRVETPGWETFSRLLFDRMHYGVDAEVAGLALVFVTELVFAWTLFLLLRLSFRCFRSFGPS